MWAPNVLNASLNYYFLMIRKDIKKIKTLLKRINASLLNRCDWVEYVEKWAM